ncbi:MAG: hypothetical protein HKN52_11760 [Eudoraea sp.]|nr:hypothetical protein [Eudoraea sp.]
MKRKLKEELAKLCSQILASDEVTEIPQLYEAAKSLYEKLAVLKFIDDKLNDIEIDVTKSGIASKFEKMANAVMEGNAAVPETNPHDEDIITPGIDTIMGMVAEMPSSAEVEKIFSDFVAKPEVIKSDKDEVTPTVSEKSVNDVLSPKEIKVGLNDRHAFVKHLFSDDADNFTRVISQLNTIDSEERSLAFIENMVKPEYDWSGKEEFETRFIEMINRRFA